MKLRSAIWAAGVLTICLALVAVVNAWLPVKQTEMRGREADLADRHPLQASLVNADASPEAKALMAYLVSIYGHGILSGQQGFDNVAFYDRYIGKRPAIIGFDFMDDSPSRVEHGTHSLDTDIAIMWHKAGGIVTFCWHWNAPKDLGKNGKDWSSGFYTDATSFDVAYAMDHPDSEDYKLILRDIDAIAAQLKILRDNHVPVLWRPLHEAEGGWFWWGAGGPEACKKLYRLMYERLTHVHHLNNLIWVWNSESPDWYPGDDVVDIVSYDSYPQAGDYGAAESHYDRLVSLVHGKKPAAMAENGPIPDPDQLIARRAGWSWFMTWGGKFLEDGEQNSLDHLKKVYNSPYVITFDELPWNRKAQ